MLLFPAGLAQTNDPPTDHWLDGPAEYPDWTQPQWVKADWFEDLHAECLVGKIMIRWSPPAIPPLSQVTLLASVGKPGQGPARDWWRYPMIRREQFWEASLPVDHPDLPILYFLSASPTNNAPGALTSETPPPEKTPAPAPPTLSPLRLGWPSRLGLETPTRIFWPFLEGFEEQLDGWQLLSDPATGAAISIQPHPKNGKAALQALIPQDKRSVTLGTTRVRGWQVLQQNATGICLWMRSPQGPAHARFTLLAHAFTTNQVVAPCRWEAALGPLWQRVDLPFEDFRGAPLADLDLVTIEVVGDGPMTLLLDDLQLMGFWPLD